MKKAPKLQSSQKDDPQLREYNWRLYEILMADLKHQHEVWMDNFRVVLTFNSILISGSFAVFALIFQGKLNDNALAFQSSSWPIVMLPVIGILTTIVMMITISRRKALTDLRQQEIREVEKTFPSLPVYPFLEGFVLGGGKSPELQSLVRPQVKRMRWYWFRGQLTYFLIGAGFIIAYMLLIVALVSS
jgi:hypothetical protein